MVSAWLFYISELDEWLRAQVCFELSRRRQGKEDKLPRRNRYQFGSLELQKRTKGPGVWIFRLSRPRQPGGDAAGNNAGNCRRFSVSSGHETRSRRVCVCKSTTVCRCEKRSPFRVSSRPLCTGRDRAGELAHTTKEPDLNRINKHISPRWGKCLLSRTKNQESPAWDVLLVRKGYALGVHSLRAKPDRPGRTQSSQQTLQTPRILTEEEFVALLKQLLQPYKSMVLLAGCTGLRISEILGLR